MLPPFIAARAIDVILLQDLAEALPLLLAVAAMLVSDPSILSYLLASAIALVMGTTLAGGTQFVRDRLSAVVSERIAKRVRESLFERIQHAPARFIDASETGDLVQRCSSDVETLRVFLHDDVDELGRATLLLAAMIPVMLYMNPALTMLAVCLIPVLISGIWVFFFQVKNFFQRVDEAEAELTSTIEENLNGIRVVQAFDRQDFEIEKFAEKNAEFRNRNYRLNGLMALYWAGADAVAMFQEMIVLIAGAWFLIQGSLTVGELFFFLTLESIVIWRVRHLGRLIFDAGKAVVAIKRINHILQVDPEDTLTGAQPLEKIGRIEFDSVSLSYSESHLDLSKLTLTIEPGEFVGVIGMSGSGKSTLIRALLRLYPIASGTIKANGKPIEDYDLREFRNAIGVVLQDPFLFALSIQDNLEVAHPNANPDEIQLATEDAAIYQSVLNFPNGFDTQIGERGVMLSGGQRQRIAIARALLKSPELLILDDSLSAVDTGTELHIVDSLLERKETRTTILIAHRLSSVMRADRIIVLHNGQIIEEGTHAALLEKQGRYARLFELQSSGAKPSYDELETMPIAAGT